MSATGHALSCNSSLATSDVECLVWGNSKRTERAMGSTLTFLRTHDLRLGISEDDCLLAEISSSPVKDISFEKAHLKEIQIEFLHPTTFI